MLGKRESVSTKEEKRTVSLDPFDTVSLERLDRQEDMKFMLRLKRERTDNVILPRQYYYSMSVYSEHSDELHQDMEQ